MSTYAEIAAIAKTKLAAKGMSMQFVRVTAGGDYWKAKAFAFDDFGKSQRIKVVQLGHEIKKNVFTSVEGCGRLLPQSLVG